ncbi:MAG: ABC transporter permease [Roseiflexaceae bacterium]|nr:ABC transporter permease [Roseiflexaceae bacterium]
MGKAATVTPVRDRTWLRRRLHWGWGALVRRQELIVFLLLLLMSAALGLGTETFFTGTNLLNIAIYVSWFAIAAFGVGIAIIVGGIDLSVAAVMALAGLVCASTLQQGLPLPVAILLGLLSGTLAGLLNGALVSKFHLPPFIVTLGTMGVARGITLGLTNGAPVRDLPEAFRLLGQGALVVGPVSLPLPLLWMLLLATLVSLMLHQTVLGRYIYVVGTDERALLVVGVPTGRVKLLAYILSGALAAFGGMIMTAKLGVASPVAASGYELDIIAAAVIGGASLFGGEGTVTGIILGALLMQITRNGLVLLGLPTFWQWLTIGAMILLVILLDFGRRRRV